MPITKRDRYHSMLNESMTMEKYQYLTVPCSTRPKTTATKAARLLAQGKYAEALKLADPVAYNVGLNEFH